MENDHLFTSEFMHRYTKFGSFREMVEASGVRADELLGNSAWNEFVVAHSSFAGWAEMFATATGESLLSEITTKRHCR